MNLFNYLELTIRDANKGIDGISTLLLLGEPGTGKTFLAESICKMWGAEKVFIQLYDGIEKEKLTMDINVPELVRGMQTDYTKLQKVNTLSLLDANRAHSLARLEVERYSKGSVNYEETEKKINEIYNNTRKKAETLGSIIKDSKYKEEIKKIYDETKSYTEFSEKIELLAEKEDSDFDAEKVILYGVLYKSIKMSLKKRVVLILDELDKADESIDVLLLDLIQNARISDPYFGNIKGDPKNIIIAITSNEEREINKALYRRVRKVPLKHPTVQQQIDILKFKLPELTEKFGDKALGKLIDISESYRSQKVVIKSNVYVLYRILMDIDALHVKEDCVDDICYSVKSWFTDRDSDKKILDNKVGLKRRVTELVKLLK